MSLDDNVKEDFSAVEKCKQADLTYSQFDVLATIASYKVLSETERTAAVCSLLRHPTQVRIRFFNALQQWPGPSTGPSL